MHSKQVKFSIFIALIILLSACNGENNSNDNLINKVNIIEDRWVNYKGTSENNKAMIQSQFIPYNPEKDYEVSSDTYVSYFNGEEFIKTELYEDTPEIISAVEEADGVILSFNKSNRNGMQLVEIE
ncbi:hypothetical protein [Jeotgalicoccus halotolerans]|uniref:Uncharacterized protein n=1 Tax=Jeotgalicoccus halotolerans TaxID=157227 RepID=A0A3E0B1M5_9STAP|nr:hypothetical protein [Jeotgalicoccus halotolerans]REG25870.1 hypothetical protein DFR63_0918 [Jeotgalicoccus halotolerans]